LSCRQHLRKLNVSKKEIELAAQLIDGMTPMTPTSITTTITTSSEADSKKIKSQDHANQEPESHRTVERATST